mmetsp:Transcript_53501/g.148318  ORF Transcript_53501/g.148318 Transcript_53501/m.148318 type:complete len:460 (-) Transcript_53501:244-1623(-)
MACEAFICQVCFESCAERLPLPPLKTVNGQWIRKADCGHPICRACMAMYVTVHVEEQRVFGIRCPVENCAVEVHELDVWKLVQTGALAVEVSERLAELRSRDYRARLEGLSETLPSLSSLLSLSAKDLGLLQVLWRTMRLCPRCSVVIEKSDGCNSFGCICGHYFDFRAAPHLFGDGVRRFDFLGVVYQYGESLNAFRQHDLRQTLMCKEVESVNTVKLLAERAHVRLGKAFLHYRAWQAMVRMLGIGSSDLMAAVLWRDIPLSSSVFKQHWEHQAQVCREVCVLDRVKLLAERTNKRIGEAYAHHREWQAWHAWSLAPASSCQDLMAATLCQGVPVVTLKHRLRQQARICRAVSNLEKLTSLARRSNLRLGQVELQHFARQGDQEALADLRVAREARKAKSKARRVATKLGLSFREGRLLVDRACSGDDAAQRAIHQARQADVVAYDAACAAQAVEVG